MQSVDTIRHLCPILYVLCAALCITCVFSSCRYQTGEVALPDYSVIFVPVPPAVQLDSANARSLPVRFYGTITAAGSDTVTRYGFVFSSSHAVPTISDSLVAMTAKPTHFPFVFELNTSQIKRATRYYLRAFAENAQGISYNTDVVQLVLSDNRTIPSVTLNAIENIAATSANTKSTLSSDGNTAITAYGLCYSPTNPNPTLADNVLVTGTSLSGALPFAYAQGLSVLITNTTYYVRSFASNAIGTAYSAASAFQTVPIASSPIVQTDNIVNSTSSSAQVDGTLTSRGTSPVTAYGVCYSATNLNPTLADGVITASTSDPASLPISYSVTLTGLSQRTTYTVRMFATNSVGTSYGVARSFTTNAPVTTSPAVQTNEVISTSITTRSATANGVITASGTASVGQYGFCYSTTNLNPTLADVVITTGTTSPASFPFSYTGELTGLSAGTVYYLRAFARSSVGTSYGVIRTFRTVSAPVSPPVVQTVNATQVSYTTAAVLGNLTSGGTSDITQYGVCYSATNANPTTADGKAIAGSSQPGSFPFAYTSNLSGLSPGTTYTVRAYASNGVGTSYGTVQRVTTSVATPSVTTDRVTYSESTSSVAVSGTIQTKGAVAITRYGFCYSASNPTPTLTDNATDVGSSVTSLPFTFTRSFIRLSVGTYYFRAYAANSQGVAYGSPIPVQVYTSPVVTTDRAADKDAGAGIETLYGTITTGGSQVITEYGFCYLPTAGAGRNFQVGDRNVGVVRKTTPVPARFPYAYALDITVSYNTDYSYRAYAKTANGYLYGAIQTFYIVYKP